MIVDECCDDWRPLSAAAALYDLADRYADVVRLAPVLEYLDKVGMPARSGVLHDDSPPATLSYHSHPLCGESCFPTVIFPEENIVSDRFSGPRRCFLGVNSVWPLSCRIAAYA
jgi:hypothetical protein